MSEKHYLHNYNDLYNIETVSKFISSFYACNIFSLRLNKFVIEKILNLQQMDLYKQFN